MLFVGIALLVAVGIAALVSADFGALFGLTQQEFGQVIFFVILLLFFGAAAFSRRQRFSTIIGNLAAWIGIFAVILIGYSYREDLKGLAAQVVGELSPTTATIDTRNGTASFRRGVDGHFLLGSTVNGAGMTLLFDTGASAVVLTYADAEKAGIDVKGLHFTTPVTTANGTGRAALVTINSMDVGGIVRGHVPAFVAEPGALYGSLLGMTFLSTLQRYTVAGDKLELTG